jgi:adenylylsulfate kinase
MEQLSASGLKAEFFDGDVIRRELCRDLGFSREDREENIRRLGYVCSLLSRHDIVAVVSAVSPYRSSRRAVRGLVQHFIEVYVNAPLAVCEERDVKGMYRKARTGALPGFTGVDDPYEPPENPEVECRTDLESIEESLAKVLAQVNSVLRAPHSAAAAPTDESRP